ncbi:protein-L-isoaspartate O-methyltransferase [Psychromonas sp. MB-3u-54]|nr:protein-L-isoaspartate O-methyltransferase [Psychromonas sp. MB-3u-54]
MVSEQIERRGITSINVLNAMRAVPRHLFVAQKLLNEAYADYPLPIGLNQTISQPYIVALMTDALGLKSHHKVLEIGTGCGYQSAVLAEIAAQVYTIEILPELAKRADNILQNLGYRNIHGKCGDGLTDWAEQAPFDRIIVTAAPLNLPLELLKQLTFDGCMVIPFGSYSQDLYRIIRKSNNQIEQQRLVPVRFVAMTGKVEKTTV